MTETQSETHDWNANKYDNASEDPNLKRQCVLEDFKQSFQEDVIEASEATGEEAIEKWSHIVKDHVSFGNYKIADSTAIFNFGAATDCPNRDSENCQVPWEACYAGKSERIYGTPLAYRRRQEFIRDALDAETFARAFVRMVERKSKPSDTLRLSEAGDFRSDADIIWADKVAEILAEELDYETYTYSASNYLDWSHREHFVLNASNPWFGDDADRRFVAVASEEEIENDDDLIWCPNDRDKRKLDKSADDATQCGECNGCSKDGLGDIGIVAH